MQDRLSEFEVVSDRPIEAAAAHLEFGLLGDFRVGRDESVRVRAWILASRLRCASPILNAVSFMPRGSKIF